MSSGLLSAAIVQRDGTGQAQRQQPALDPNYIPLEERSLADWIAFAQQYTSELNFFDENNEATGDWKNFLSDIDIPALLAYVENSDAFSVNEEIIEKYSRPHLVLFISFLQLLGFIKDQLNGFTKKHLDFYYYDILGLTKKGPLPDEANIIVQLVDDVQAFFVAQGTPLSAGQDSFGKDLIYVTKQDTLISQAQIEKIKTLYTGKKTTTLQQVQENNPDERLMQMMRLALGDPNPGDPLPQFGDTTVDILMLKDISTHLEDKDKLAYITNKLFFEEATDFTKIMVTYASPTANWSIIAARLKEAYNLKKTPSVNDTTSNVAATAGAEPFESNLIDGPMLVEWENAYIIPDAKAGAFASGKDGDSTLCFNTFGEGHQENELTTAAPASIGFAITSPQLLLQEGTRTIVLTLHFNNKGSKNWLKDASTGALRFPFSLFVSTNKGWVLLKEPEQYSVQYVNGDADDNYTGINIKIQFAATDPAIVAPDAPGDRMTITSDYPVIGFIINQNETAGAKNNYQLFKDLQLQNVEVAITATTLKALTLENDDAILNYKKPFEPFDFTPETGSHFYFAHPEICSKPLNTLTLHFEWMNAPAVFSEYYNNYKDTDGNTLTLNNSSFTAHLQCINDNTWIELNKTVSLFDSTNAVNTHAVTTNVPHLQPEIIAPETEAINWKRYFSLELGSPDFQQQVYQQLLIKNALSKSTDTINPPYTPKLKSFTVDYTTTFIIDFNTSKAGAGNSLFHINAFGYSTPAMQETKSNDKNGNSILLLWTYLLPQFEYEGELYIGIDRLAVPQNLSLFFQLAEGSADPDLDKPQVLWSYLSNNAWLPLQGTSIISDTTNGLMNTGIIELAIPANATCKNTLLNENLYWLRAGVAINTEAVPDTVAIYTQGITAIFTDNDNAPEHYLNLLPPGSIKETAAGIPEIKKVSQPYSSTKGKPPEEDSQFYIRVSERLRHKDRALTSWDYEHLILEHFPEIYKVKCVPADDIGSAVIIVIPDIKGKLPFNPFQPKAPANVIADIQQYLNIRVSPWAIIIIKNPLYIQVKVRIAVKIKDGYSENFFLAKLEEELIRYLAPWAYDEGAEIDLDTRLDADVIVNFVAERFYVEYAADIHLFTSINGKDFTKINPVNGEYYVQAINPGDILVSADTHVIDPIHEYAEDNYRGIGYMKVGLDFKLHEHAEDGYRGIGYMKIGLDFQLA